MLIGSEKDQASYLPKHGTFGLTVRSLAPVCLEPVDVAKSFSHIVVGT